jgi:hypothetical protein
MKGIAEPFDVAKVDFYKEVQRKISRGLVPVMELEAEDGASVSDTTITVFGTDRSDLRRLGTVRREVHVALLDPRSDEQFLYPATILHSGLLSASDAAAGGISFSPRRCAHRQGRQFAALQPFGPVDQAVLNTAEYFVTVRLGALNPLLVSDYPAPRAAILEEVSDESSPLLRRLDAAARAQLFGGREIRVKRPTVAADESRPRTVAARRSLPEHPLVSMRVLLSKTP